MSYKFLRQEIKDRILVLTIDREKSLNALNSELIREFKKCLTEISLNNEIDVVIITGAGKSFVAGADIGEMAELSSYESTIFAKNGMDTFLKLEHLSKPTIAAINGFALGGGCELALACDIRIASTKAKIGQPEVSLGITPGFGGTQRLSRAINLSKAKELIYTGDFISAQEALDVGLVSYVVEPDELMDKAFEIANRIKKNSQTAIRYSKEAINTGIQADIETAMNIERANFALCFATEDQKEGMKAFLEKRKPNFKGE